MSKPSKPVLLIVTEAALEHPDAVPLSPADMERVNGVVRTYQGLDEPLKQFYDVRYLTPFDYPGEPKKRGMLHHNRPFPVPQQKSLRTVFPSTRDMDKRIGDLKPAHVHIATEGPMGLRAMNYCKKHGISVSSAFHTNWQQYVKEEGFGIPGVPRDVAAKATLAFLKRFHKKADAVMAATPELKEGLVDWGLKGEKIHLVNRGVDTKIFRPYKPEESPSKEEYIVCIGRVAPGKGVEDFCNLDTRGIRKIVVGTGPIFEELKAKHPEVEWAGYQQGANLGKYYAGAKLFVLPSETETLGMTVMESLACGTPVAALTRGGHQPIINAAPGLGVMKDKLQDAVDSALEHPEQFMPRDKIAAFAHKTMSWAHEAENFHDMAEAAKPQAKKRKFRFGRSS
ncbi:MAG: glycosyltransferase family 1 protein [Alphaproteobacteria bacterium]|nr:MAG: glycosyltransferase family 1 protein [Alphaproteobacteria bacterium]